MPPVVATTNIGSKLSTQPLPIFPLNKRFLRSTFSSSVSFSSSMGMETFHLNSYPMKRRNLKVPVEEAERMEFDVLGRVFYYQTRVALHKFFLSIFKVLCKSHPLEFPYYFHYCQSLAFDQRPDYGFLKCLFRDLFTLEGLQLDYLYDWTAQRYRQAQREKNEPQPSRLQTGTGVTSSRVIPRDLHKHQRRIGDVRAHQRCTNAARRGFVLQCQLA